MSAINYLLEIFLDVLLSIFLMRVLLPLVRADARNPISQVIIRFTNPLVLPLRRIFPPSGRFDTAAMIALIVVQLAVTSTLMLIKFHFVTLRPLVVFAGFDLLVLILQFYKWATIMYALLSWVAPDTYSPASSILTNLVTPIVRPWRRLVPPIGGLDFSAAFTIIALQATLYLLYDFKDVIVRWMI